MFGILIVDHHPRFRGSVSSVLRNRFAGILIDDAGDGPTALHKLSAGWVNMVLVDVTLPGISGIELTAAIKAKYPQTAVVVLSSYDVPCYRQAAFCKGADCFLYKGSGSCVADVIARVEGAIRMGPGGGRLTVLQ